MFEMQLANPEKMRRYSTPQRQWVKRNADVSIYGAVKSGVDSNEKGAAMHCVHRRPRYLSDFKAYSLFVCRGGLSAFHHAGGDRYHNNCTGCDAQRNRRRYQRGCRPFAGSRDSRSSRISGRGRSSGLLVGNHSIGCVCLPADKEDKRYDGENPEN